MLKKVLLFMAMIGCLGLLGCGGGPRLLDHDPTEAELKQALEEAFLDVFRYEGLLDDTLARFKKPKIEWAIMGKAEREHHMARYVMPVMLTLFQSFDKHSNPDDFDQAYYAKSINNRFGGGTIRTSISDSFSCLTCHGDSFPTGNVANFDFSRPSHLYPLDPNNLPTVENPGNSSARMIKFMQYTVTPAMRILLGRSDVNCFTCHQKK